MTYRTFFVLSFVVAGSLFSVPSAFGGVQGSVKIEQISASSYGSWTLISEDGSSRSSKDEGVDVTGGYAMSYTEFGQHTLSVTPPAGMSTKISVYRGGDLIAELASQQHSFPILANDNYRIVIAYSLTRVGSLGITSVPSSLSFRMKGPTRRTYAGRTPHTFTNLPSGKYSLYFQSTDTCFSPAVKTVDVQSGQRNTALVSLTCTAETVDNVDRSRISKRALIQYVEQRELKPRGERK